MNLKRSGEQKYMDISIRYRQFIILLIFLNFFVYRLSAIKRDMLILCTTEA